MRASTSWLAALFTTALLAACSGGAQDGPGAASAEATRPVGEIPSAASSPRTSEGATSAPVLAPRSANVEAREAAALKILQGELDAKQLPVEATEAGQPLDTSLRDKLAPRARPPQVRMADIKVTGRLPPEVIQRIVRQNFGRFRVCYEHGLEIDSTLEGTVEVHFTIDATGAVKDVAERGSTMKDADVKKCVAKVFPGLSFPSPEGGVVQVTYPIKFSPPVE